MASLLRDIPIKSFIKLNENGVSTEFAVMKHNYESGYNGNGRTLLVRKIYLPDPMPFDATNNDFLNSDLLRYLTDAYLPRFDADIRELIGTTMIRYKPGLGDDSEQTTSLPVFILNLTEYFNDIADNIYGNTDDGMDFRVGLPDGVGEWLVFGLPNIGGEDQYSNQVWTRSPSDYKSSGTDHTKTFVGVVGWQYADVTPKEKHRAAWKEGVNCEYYIQPAITLPDTAIVDDNGYIVTNTPPSISGSDTDLGTFGLTKPSPYTYTITDAQNNVVTVTEKLDGNVWRTYTPTLDQSYNFDCNDTEWMQVLNGNHTIEIIASDGKTSVTRTLTFTKQVNQIQFYLNPCLVASQMPSKAQESIIAKLPEGTTCKVEICNNANDINPTWQDITQKCLSNRNIVITNTIKTAANWGYNIRVTIDRGTATGPVWISGGSGFFE